MDIVYIGRFASDSAFFTQAFRSGNGIFEPTATLDGTTELALQNQPNLWTTTFTGTGFAVDGSGQLTGGTATGLTIAQNGTTIVTVTGISWPITEFIDAMRALIDDGDGAAFGTLMSGSGPITLDASGSAVDFSMAQFLDFNGTITQPMTIIGSNFVDALVGAQGDDDITLGGASDTSGDQVLATTGDDTIRLVTNSDVASVDYSNLTAITAVIDGRANTGSVAKSGAGSDTFENVAGALIGRIGGTGSFDVAATGLFLTGTSGDDSVTAVVADEQTLTLFGLGGNDRFDLTLLEGATATLSHYFNASQGMVADLSTGTISNDGAGGSDRVIQRGVGQLEIWATERNDRLTGGARDDSFAALAGDDTIDGGAGNDRLRYDILDYASVNVDMTAGTVAGNTGRASFNDVFTSIEWLIGTTGNDTITGTAGRDTIDGSDGNDILDGGANIDFVQGGNGDDTIDGGDNTDRIEGGSGDDMLIGGTGFDNIFGGTGDDTIDGGTEADRLYGEDGNDVIRGGANFGLSVDGLVGGAGNDSLYGEAGFDVLRGGDDDDYLDGGNQADNLYGDAGNDTLVGGAGFDRLFGGEGDDLIQGGDGPDGHFGDAGNDTIEGGSGNDRFFGGSGNDLISGGDGDDTIYANAGFDTVEGGAGNDLLYGLFNADRFVFADGHGQDTIADFDAASDLEKIDLSAVSAITNLTDLAVNHMSQVGSDVQIDTGGGDLIVLTGVSLAALDAADFIF